MSFPRVAVSVAPGLLRFVSLRSTNIAEGIGVFESAPIPLTDLENFSEEARTGIKTVVSGFLEHKGHRHAVVVFPEEDVYLFPDERRKLSDAEQDTLLVLSPYTKYVLTKFASKKLYLTTVEELIADRIKE